MMMADSERERGWLLRALAVSIDAQLLSWYRHLERMDGEGGCGRDDDNSNM